MPPIVVLIACLLFIFLLFRIDITFKPNVSSAIWIPTIWVMIIASRPLGFWLHITPADNAEGSLFDAILYTLFMLTGLYILKRRGIQFLDVGRNNKWMVVFFLYGLISVGWSDIPFVTLKRLVKTLGNPVMALVILSEEDLLDAIKTVYRRAAYVLLPLSFVCINYFPSIGRDYANQGGVMFRGVTGQKNDLGLICFIFGVVACWWIIKMRHHKLNRPKYETMLSVFIMCAAFALLIKSNSATSLVCYIVGVCILLGTEFTYVKRDIKHFEFIAITVAFAYILLEYLVDIKQLIIESLGRDSTLTSRVPIWDMLRGMKTNPIVGSGFESFWTKDRIELMDNVMGTHSVHNGYLDIYLNLGIIGLVIFGLMVLSAYITIRNSYNSNTEYNILRIAFFATILIYGYTEAYYVGLNLIYFTFFLCIIDFPYLKQNLFVKAKVLRNA